MIALPVCLPSVTSRQAQTKTYRHPNAGGCLRALWRTLRRVLYMPSSYQTYQTARSFFTGHCIDWRPQKMTEHEARQLATRIIRDVNRLKNWAEQTTYQKLSRCDRWVRNQKETRTKQRIADRAAKLGATPDFSHDLGGVSLTWKDKRHPMQFVPCNTR